MASKSKTKKPVQKKEKLTYSAADKKKMLITALTAVIILVIAVWFMLAYNGAVKTIKPVRDGVHSYPEEIGVDDYADIEVKTLGGDTLKGWYMPASGNTEELGDKVVITSHNYESSREMIEISGMYFYAYLIEAGYDVVAFDYSGSGESYGRYYTFGCRETDELLSVIDYVHEMNPDADIALCGWAFGAAAAINAGCRSEHVSAIIADSSYTDLDAYLRSNLKIWTKLPSLLFDGAVKAMMEGLADCDFSNSSPINAIKETSGKSFYFIHSKNDTVIPTASSEALFTEAEKNNTAYIWILSDVPHISGFMEQEDNYKNRIIDFLINNF